jgi:2-polyprenyl-6-methoxyphenol hydroxylase-like FAD-dependent oxidoreductase
MPRIVVVGGGLIGLATAMMLAEDGCEVTVVERDGDAVPGSPGDAWRDWDRRGIAQFRQAHYLHSGGRQILDSRLPEVSEAMRGAGATTFDSVALLPPFIEDRAPREGDERFVTLTGRRPVLEYAFATCAERQVDVRRGVTVAELVTGQPAAQGVPHVTGVRTSDGEHIACDLVIDAMGRRSDLPRWLAALGARPLAEEAEDSGFTYYTRYFRSPSGEAPAFIAGLLTHFDSFSLLTLPGDAETWSVTIYISSRDRALKELRHPDNWAALVAACPLHAHLAQGEAISEIIPMSGVVDRQRRMVVDGTPVATGIVPVGDALCCTNPSLGRGVTTGLMHAAGTAEVIGEHLGDPLALAAEHDRMSQARIMPWYRQTIQLDRARKAQIDASIAGESAAPDTDPPGHDGGDMPGWAELQVAMLYDPDAFRAFLEIISLHALPEDIMARPGFSEHLAEAAAGREVFEIPGPSRGDLLQSLA